MNDVKEISQNNIKRLSENIGKNNNLVLNYYSMAVESVMRKFPRPEIEKLVNRANSVENCNKFWRTATYESNNIKQLLQTYLCHDKFCINCKRIKQFIVKKRFLPYMEKYKDYLYHVVLTVTACTGEQLHDTIDRMKNCFKTLVTYLNGNKKIKGLDFEYYGFQGCIRSLEIGYSGDVYHPHFHIAAVFNNPSVAENKSIDNKFSSYGSRLFSEFEAILQRVWWLLINQQRLTYENIFINSAEDDRYSCICDKFQPEEYDKLFGYMTKAHSEDTDRFMTYKYFRVLYRVLYRTRQVQGYGIFYNTPAVEDDSEYTEQEYRDIAEYIISDEQPIVSNESLSRLVEDKKYVIIKKKYHRKKDITLKD